jgi:hypothetical protein
VQVVEVVMRWILVVVGVGCVVGCGPSAASASSDGAGWTEPDTGVTVLDSDVLSEDQHEAVIAQGLTVAQVDGHDDLWSRAQRQSLTWCVDAKGFGAATDDVLAAMSKATGDWEAVANVKFVHVPAEDLRCSRSNAKVLFDVRGVSGRPYLARSFFPSSPRASREVLIDGSAVPPGKPLTLAGVLRHELGHVLGLRHEHTRDPANPCYEDANWRAVTAYDVRSVMHYPQCAGVGGRDLTLTPLDKQGIATLYP